MITDVGAERCYRHTAVEAVYTCKECGKKICRVCAFPYDQGTGYQCPDCASNSYAVESRPPDTAPAKILQAGTKCLHHPDVPADCLCDQCHTPVCATCAFIFPGDRHICPKCAENNEIVISPRRKKNVIWSFCCGVGGLLLFIIFFVRAQGIETQSELEANSTVFGSLIIIISVVGLALGLGAMDKRLGNTMSMWIAAAWNAIILGAFILLCVVGLFMS